MTPDVRPSCETPRAPRAKPCALRAMPGTPLRAMPCAPLCGCWAEAEAKEPMTPDNAPHPSLATPGAPLRGHWVVTEEQHQQLEKLWWDMQ